MKAFIDLEFDSQNKLIVQISCVKENGEEFNEYIKLDNGFDSLSDDWGKKCFKQFEQKINNAKKTLQEVLKELEEFISECENICGFDIINDKKMLLHNDMEIKKTWIDLKNFFPFSNNGISTRTLGWILKDKNLIIHDSLSEAKLLKEIALIFVHPDKFLNLEKMIIVESYRPKLFFELFQYTNMYIPDIDEDFIILNNFQQDYEFIKSNHLNTIFISSKNKLEKLKSKSNDRTFNFWYANPKKCLLDDNLFKKIIHKFYNHDKKDFSNFVDYDELIKLLNL